MSLIMETDVYFFFFLFLLVGHVLPIPSATDKDGEDDELVYWLEKTTKIPFELVSFGSNQIGTILFFYIPLIFFFFDLSFSFKCNRTIRSRNM